MPVEKTQETVVDGKQSSLEAAKQLAEQLSGRKEREEEEGGGEGDGKEE